MENEAEKKWQKYIYVWKCKKNKAKSCSFYDSRARIRETTNER